MNEETNSALRLDDGQLLEKDGRQVLPKISLDLFEFADKKGTEIAKDTTKMNIENKNDQVQSFSGEPGISDSLVPDLVCKVDNNLEVSVEEKFLEDQKPCVMQHDIALSNNAHDTSNNNAEDKKSNLLEFPLDPIDDSKDLDIEMKQESIEDQKNELDISSQKNKKDKNKRKDIEKRFSCEHCEKRFAYHRQLVKHNRIHTGGKPYKCSNCSFVFKRNDHLIRHQKTHSDEKPFKCDNCDGAFKRKDHLLRHSRTHSAGEKIATDDECSMVFQSKEDGDKKIHTRSFKSKKSFTKIENVTAPFKTNEDFSSQMKENMCLICSKTFSRKSHTLRHMKIHSGNKEKPSEEVLENNVSLTAGEVIENNVSLTPGEAIEDHDSNEKSLSNFIDDVSNGKPMVV